MHLSDFQAGKYVRQSSGYNAFVPNPINHSWTIDDPSLLTLLEETSQSMGELKSISLVVPDMDRFVPMYIAKEATLSSRIEGTQTTLAEALLPLDEIAPERRDDWVEVQNYIAALNQGMNRLQSLPLSNRLLREAHHRLMQGVRGERKEPGNWRRSQNWIGGTSPSNALFVPPPHDYVADLMSDLEKFWHNDGVYVPHLIRAAISHYQFETIHPFLDGNGRIGRLLISLYLIDRGMLEEPTLYVSTALEGRREEYYQRLTDVREKNAMQEWIAFFLNVVGEAARDGTSTMKRILRLRIECEQSVLKLGSRAGKGRILLDHLFRNTFVSIPEVRDLLQVSYPTAKSLVDDFVQADILVESRGRGRGKNYFFEPYWQIHMKQEEYGDGPKR